VRWALLAELCALALGYAALRFWTEPRRRRPAVAVPALAALLVGLAVLSSAWSASPGLTLGRALTLTALLVTCCALAYGTGGRHDAVGQLLLGVLAGAAVLGLGGLLTLALDPDRAIVPAVIGKPALYNGLGSNPNALALLFAVALPLAAWAFVEARSRAGKAVAAILFLVFDGSLTASGARGALLGALVGVAALVCALPLRRRRRVALVGATAALLVVNVVAWELPPTAARNPVLHPEFGATVPINDRDAQFIRPLENEIAVGELARRFEEGPLGSSGRVQAWAGALRQASERPLLGYGFGTEERVFVDRFYPFVGDRPENSYVGTALQLGFVGVGLLVGLLVAVLVPALSRLRTLAGYERRVAAVCLAAVACGLVLALTQSYLTSVGSTATVPFWLAAFLLAAVRATASRDAATSASSNPRTGIAKRAST
jgi:O-antigen ligase